MTPAKDYEYITETCCPDCKHVHPKDKACVIPVLCKNCGSPAGLRHPDNADYAECFGCISERNR